ncbi:MAG: glycine cleavage system protein GcvH [Nitrospinae bacterium]|nr:glycine cleavage system protein GcvH [Nitrospinota bacterium]
MDFPEDLLYTKEHEWVRIENGKAVIGITEYAQQELGDIVFVEFPTIGTEVEHMEPFGVIESVKTVADLYSPLTGEVLDVNHDLETQPELINSSPYDKGWIIEISINNTEEIDQLLSHNDYLAHLKEDIEE